MHIDTTLPGLMAGDISPSPSAPCSQSQLGLDVSSFLHLQLKLASFLRQVEFWSVVLWGEMAQPGARLDPETFSCCLSLDFLKDPVTTSCVHSSCGKCLQHHWVNRRRGEYTDALSVGRPSHWGQYRRRTPCAQL